MYSRATTDTNGSKYYCCLLLCIIKIVLLPVSQIFALMSLSVLVKVRIQGFSIVINQQQQRKRRQQQFGIIFRRINSFNNNNNIINNSIGSTTGATGSTRLKYHQMTTNHNNNYVDSNVTSSSITIPTTTISMIGLHGSGGNGVQFEQQVLVKWNDYFNSKNIVQNENETQLLPKRVNFTINTSTITGPVQSIDNKDGYQWWSMPPNVRSSIATTYEPYFSISQQLVVDALLNCTSTATTGSSNDTIVDKNNNFQVQQQYTKDEIDQYDTNSNLKKVIIAHSQGAILLISLLVLEQIPMISRPNVAYIVNGVGWPNPYTQQLEQLLLVSSSNTTTTTTNNNTKQQQQQQQQRILFIIGMKDNINEPSSALRIAYILQQSQLYNVTILQHPGGHSVPLPSTEKNQKLLDTIYEWILQ